MISCLINSSATLAKHRPWSVREGSVSVQSQLVRQPASNHSGDVGHACARCDSGEIARFLLLRRYRAGGTPNTRLKARLNAASDS